MEGHGRVVMEKERAAFLSGSGKIAPFGETFHVLVEAVSRGEKPIAEYDRLDYLDNQPSFDETIRNGGLEKIDDPTRRCVWFFKPSNREDAFGRIAEINHINHEIDRRGYSTLKDHTRKGELFGYAEADSSSFLRWRSVLILRNYATTGKAEFAYRPMRAALTQQL